MERRFVLHRLIFLRKIDDGECVLVRSIRAVSFGTSAV